MAARNHGRNLENFLQALLKPQRTDVSTRKCVNRTTEIEDAPRRIGNFPTGKALSMRDTQRWLHPLRSRPGSNFPEKKGFAETSRRHQRRWRVQINFAARPANQVRDNRAVTEFTNPLENRESPMER